ncbi:unnamed protein product [Durusdinium trenchii]|uniref:Uncharacterized protein n=2 Tax=Durusdinium trenchii TaxID=1381693 RepID=A0ABP0L3J3_9DINO
MASPREMSPPAGRLHNTYAPVETEIAGECRRLLGCNLAIAMLCVLFTISCLVVTVILDPAAKVKKDAQRSKAASELFVAPSPATESWKPEPSRAETPRPILTETSTAWPTVTAAWPKPPTLPPTAPPMVLVTGPPNAPEALRWQPTPERLSRPEFVSEPAREDAPAAKPSSTREDTVLTAPEKFTTLEKTRSEGNLLVPLPTAAGDIV